METRGRLNDIGIKFVTGKAVITFEVTAPPEECEKYIGEDLDISFKKHREKRSLSANDYFHVLVTNIADARTLRGDAISKTREKNELICKYGQPLRMQDGSEVVYKTNAPADWMAEQEYIHAKPIKFETDQKSGVDVTFYKIFRGSHTYDTREMAALIDGTIEDAKEWGVETMTPDELARLKASWESR